MEKEFVPYELALKLKEVGFNKNCMAYFFTSGKLNKYWNKYYNNTNPLYNQPFKFSCVAPLWQQAFDWFRKEHYLRKNPIYIGDNKWRVKDQEEWIGKKCMIMQNIHTYTDYDDYDEARKACLKKLIEIIIKHETNIM